MQITRKKNRAIITGLIEGHTITLRQVAGRWSTGQIQEDAVPANVFAFTFPSDITVMEDALQRVKTGLPLLVAECKKLFREGGKYRENPKLKYEYRTYPANPQITDMYRKV